MEPEQKAESLWHANASKEPDRRRYFEFLVLSGIWVLIMRAFGMNPWKQACEFRQVAIDYFDANGGQREGQREYRRNVHFEMIKPLEKS